MPPVHLAHRGLTPLATAVLAGLIYVAEPAQAQDGAFSVGAGTSFVQGRIDCVSTQACDKSELGLRVFGAYRLASGLELQVLYLEPRRFEGGGSTLAGNPFGGDFKVQALGLAGGYRWPVAGGWVLKANAGIAAVRTTFRYAPPFTGDVRKTVAQPIAGLGIAYPVSPGWELSFDYDATRFKAHTQYGSLQMLGLSVRHSF